MSVPGHSLLVLIPCLVAWVAPTRALADSIDDSRFVHMVNSERARRGLAPLTNYEDLEDDAESHSQKMAHQRVLMRIPDLASVTTGWRSLAQYEGRGSSVAELFQGAMMSAEHRGHLLGTYDRIGVAVSTGQDGNKYLTVLLMQTAT